MPEIEIRPYREGDHTEVARIWFEGPLSWDTSAQPPLDLRQTLFAQVPRELAAGWSLHVATDRNRIVGMLALKPNENQLDQLFVDPSSQNRGVGRILLDHAKQVMPKGFWLQTLVRNRGARRFYEREGLLHKQDKPHPNLPSEMLSIYEWKPTGSSP
jgi:GNAT superfamily N-acetyltransferase